MHSSRFFDDMSDSQSRAICIFFSQLHCTLVTNSSQRYILLVARKDTYYL